MNPNNGPTGNGLSYDPCNCAHCRMNKLEALTVDLKAAQVERDKAMVELEAKIAETNESLTVSAESLPVGKITLSQEEAAKMWQEHLAVNPVHSDAVDPLVTVRSIFKKEHDRLRESGENGVSASIGGILKIVDSFDERISLVEKAFGPNVVVSIHDASSSLIGAPTGVGDVDPKPTEGTPAPLRNHWTLNEAVELLAGIAHYTLRVEQDSVTDSIEIGLETCMDLEEIVNRARLAAEASVSTWGTHWHASRGNLRVLHTCGDRCGKRSS